MRTGIAILWLLLMLPVSAHATTLRLSGDINLLVLDGKKVSSLLLRGAESIELDNGPHQVVFRVEKMVILPDQNRQLYVSPPLIANFNSQLIGQVNFSLPRLETLQETQAFTSTPHVSLLDGNAMPIPVKLDILAITQVGDNIDYEKAIEAYNLASKQASDTQFSMPLPDDSTLLSKTTELDNPAYQSQTLTEQRLKYWFQLADPATRHRFLEWAKSQPSS
ncbi:MULTISPECIES: curli synthesis inhibitor [Enterobacterales]|uniref:curli synthesis inhibitor n=1 Tax=Enterobacterales TaxID=91347 RepID=UPI002ED7AF29